MKDLLLVAMLYESIYSAMRISDYLKAYPESWLAKKVKRPPA